MDDFDFFENIDNKEADSKAVLGIAIAIIAATPAVISNVNKILASEMTLPNFPLEVIDGGIFWDVLAETNDWRLQQNEITKHCRILDPNNIRRAWGTKNGMICALKSLAKENL